MSLCIISFKNAANKTASNFDISVVLPNFVVKLSYEKLSSHDGVIILVCVHIPSKVGAKIPGAVLGKTFGGAAPPPKFSLPSPFPYPFPFSPLTP